MTLPHELCDAILAVWRAPTELAPTVWCDDDDRWSQAWEAFDNTPTR